MCWENVPVAIMGAVWYIVLCNQMKITLITFDRNVTFCGMRK